MTDTQSSKERNAAGFYDIGPLVIDDDTFAEFEDGTGSKSYEKHIGKPWTNSAWLTPDRARALRDWLTRALGESPAETSAPSPVQTEVCPVHDKPLCPAPETGAALTFDTTFQRMRESLRKLIEATERFDNPGDYGVSSCAPVMNEARAALREANEIEKAALHDLLARAAEELLNCDASGRPTGSCGDLGMEIKRRLGEKTSGNPSLFKCLYCRTQFPNIVALNKHEALCERRAPDVNGDPR